MDELIDALRSIGHEVIIVGPARVASMEFGDDAGFIATLKRVLPRALYEILEAGYSIPAFFRLYRAYRAHRPDVVYERYNLFMFAGAWLKKLTGVRVLLEVNGPLYEERMEHDGLSLERFAAWAQAVVWRGVDVVLPVTNVLADYVRAYGVPENRIAIIPNGINTERFADSLSLADAKRRLGLENRLVLGFTGFVRSWNSLDAVIDLIANDAGAHDLHLLLVGDGPARAELEAQAERLDVSDRVTVTGVVERDDVASYVAAFDIALIPGVTEYASPLKLFEYLALGRAVIAPDMPNIREILEDGKNAVLFQPEDKQAFAQAILTACESKELRDRVSTAGKSTISEQGLTWRKNAEKVVALA